MKDFKLTCDCAAKEILWVSDFDDGQLAISIDANPKKKKKYLPEVIVDKQKLLEKLTGLKW